MFSYFTTVFVLPLFFFTAARLTQSVEMSDNRAGGREFGIQSFRTHGSFVPRRFILSLRHFVAAFDQFVPNPLDDSYPTNYDTKSLKQT